MKNEPLEGRIAVLEMQVAAQHNALLAIALTLSRAKRMELVALLTAMQLNAAVETGADAGEAMQPIIDQLLAHAGEKFDTTATEVRQHLAIRAALFAAAPPDRREALELWLSAATEQEIADEISATLRSLPSTPVAPRKRGKGGAS